MKYKNNNFLFLLLIILILLVFYVFKTNESYNNIDIEDINKLECLNEQTIYDLTENIINLESTYDKFKSIDKDEFNKDLIKSYKMRLKQILDNLLLLFQKIVSTQISCILSNKKQLTILNKFVQIIEEKKEKLREIKSSLMNDFKNITNSADILPNEKTIELEKLDTFSKLFNNLSYIFNDNPDYNIDSDGNIRDKNGNKIGKDIQITDNKGKPLHKANLYKEITPKCGFVCKHNNHYHDPNMNEPQYKEISHVAI